MMCGLDLKQTKTQTSPAPISTSIHKSTKQHNSNINTKEDHHIQSVPPGDTH